MGGKGNKRGWSIGSLLLVFVLLVAATGFLLYPEYVFWQSQKAMDKDSAFIDALSGNDKAVNPGLKESTQQIEPSLKTAYDQALPILKVYNAEVRAGRGPAINDPFGFDESNNMLADLGIKDGLIGYINSPSMKCRLPLYLGATDANMRKGAAVISGTSVPLGQSDSNCVIAAHRGYDEAAMFRDIENIEIGDELEIVTAWETMVYRAVDIKTIAPDDSGALKVVEGRDLITLFTCHPYGYNYQRYLVYCEKVGSADSDFHAEDYGMAVSSVNGIGGEGDAQMIFDKLKVEKVLRPIALAALGLFFIWWIVALVRSLRTEK